MFKVTTPHSASISADFGDAVYGIVMIILRLLV